MENEESLLSGNDTQNDETTTETTTTETPAETTPWYVSEGVAGEGDKPDWYKDSKYKSVSAQAEAYAGLETKLGGFTGAPDEYESSMPDGIEGEFVNDDPLMNDFKTWAKDNQLNQEAFTNILHMFVKNEHQSMGLSRESELAAIGDNAESRLKNIEDFGKANLSEDEFQGLLQATTTAAGVKAIEALISQTRTPKIPTTDAEVDTGLSHSDLRERMKDPRYQSDPAFRAETSKLYERKFGKEPARTTIG